MGVRLYGYGVRFYDPSIGRFTTVDPLAEAAPDWSPFRYGFNNPLRFIDPSGMTEEDFINQHQNHAADPGNPIKQLFREATAFVAGALYAFGSNNLLGAGRQDPNDWGSDLAGAAQAGQTLGDLAAVVTGSIEAVAGGTGTVAVAATGVGIAATPATAAVTTHGAPTTGVALKNLLNPSKVEANNLKPSPTGPGTVPKAQRDPQRVPTASQKKEQLAQQNGKCANCEKQIQVQESRSHHYPTRHADGGSNTIQVCQTCHPKLHKKTAIIMNQILKNIEEIIKKHGFFRYNVLQETTPRYSYTIGLTKSIGFELILGGMLYFESDEELELIFNTISEELIKNNQTRKFNINGLGFFKLVEVDISWVTKTMLGAIDFYKIENIEAFQIVTLDSEKITLDTPDMSKKWSSKNTIWKYLEQDEPWQYKIPKNGIAITNLAALKGNRLTEIFRYEIDEWEIFSGNGAVEPKESIRIVPIIILLGLDKTIEEFIDEPIGKGRFRDSSDENNPIWYNWE